MRELDCHPPTNADVGGATATALRVIDPGLLMKFEMDQAGGSHKARAARHVVRRAVADGHIVPGHTTVIEKTGGNFGVGLQLACAALGVRVELAVGLSFSTGKRRYLEWIGCQLVGLEEMRQGATPREVLERRLAQAPAESRLITIQTSSTTPGAWRPTSWTRGRNWCASCAQRWVGEGWAGKHMGVDRHHLS